LSCPDRRGGKPATKPLSYGAVSKCGNSRRKWGRVVLHVTLAAHVSGNWVYFALREISWVAFWLEVIQALSVRISEFLDGLIFLKDRLEACGQSPCRENKQVHMTTALMAVLRATEATWDLVLLACSVYWYTCSYCYCYWHYWLHGSSSNCIAVHVSMTYFIQLLPSPSWSSET
jgi:hypothetical protein